MNSVSHICKHILVFLSLTLVACSEETKSTGNNSMAKTASSETMAMEQSSTTARDSVFCELLILNAEVILGNYEAQKMAGTSDPLAAVKSWIQYEDAEIDSPAKLFYDLVLQASQDGATKEQVGQEAEKVCDKYSEDDLDPANFYSKVN